MKRSKRLGFTLVELLVVITIIGTLMSLLLPAVQQARESARAVSCKNSMRQLALALISYEQSQRRFPGYVESFGSDPTRANQQIRGSWIVAIFPYMEEQNVYDRWVDFHEPVAPGIAVLNCASDPPENSNAPSLSYVVNAGRNPQDTTRFPQPPIREHQANGMFFDRSCPPQQGQGSAGRGAPQPSDPRQTSNGCVMLEMSAGYLDSHDGSSKTAMVSENVNALYYVYSDSQSYDNSIPDEQKYFGFVWSNSPSPRQRINGSKDNPPANPLDMKTMTYDHAWPSSNHPGYVNVAYADGHLDQMFESIDPAVYRQLMTTRAKSSHDMTRDLIQ